MTHQPDEYVFIRRWGTIMGSFEYFIKEQQQLAAAENAPLTAIYKIYGTDSWAVAERVKNPSVRERLYAPITTDMRRALPNE